MDAQAVLSDALRRADRVRVGVTGHRALPGDRRLTQQVDRALQRIQALAAGKENGARARLTVVSALAEGADRLVAREILREPGAILEVPLPLPPADYMQDFPTEESKREFEGLLRRADLVLIMPPAESRTEAYQAAGHYIVDHCHVLLALWDGKPARGQGGTAEIVTLALRDHVPLIWIATQPPYALSEHLDGNLERP